MVCTVESFMIGKSADVSGQAVHCCYTDSTGTGEAILNLTQILCCNVY